MIGTDGQGTIWYILSLTPNWTVVSHDDQIGGWSMKRVVTRQVKSKYEFGLIMPSGDIYWYAGSYASERHAHRAAEKRIVGYKYADRG